MTPEEKQSWLDQLICPECKEHYPERTITYDSDRGMKGHRYFRHGVLYPGSVSAFPQAEDGTFSCPDCAAVGFINPAVVGKHRWTEHGKRGKWFGVRKKAEANRAAAKKQATQLTLPKVAPTVTRPPDTVAIYLFGRAENEIENYARKNNLQAGELMRQVGALLQMAK